MNGDHISFMRNIIFIFAVSITERSLVSASRRYNLEEECQKLYREDLRTVLARFRKTPEYLRIMIEKSEHQRGRFLDIVVQAQGYHQGSILERVMKMIGEDHQGDGLDATEGETTPRAPICNKHRYLRTGPFGWMDPSDLARSGCGGGGDEDTGYKKPDKSGIDLLDEYSNLHSHLSLAQRNAFKDLGFEIAGNVIHTVIKALGPDAETVRVTLHPFGGDLDSNRAVVTTTEHVHKHTVRKSTEKGFDEEASEEKKAPASEQAMRMRADAAAATAATAANTIKPQKKVTEATKVAKNKVSPPLKPARLKTTTPTIATNNEI